MKTTPTRKTELADALKEAVINLVNGTFQRLLQRQKRQTCVFEYHPHKRRPHVGFFRFQASKIICRACPHTEHTIEGWSQIRRRHDWFRRLLRQQMWHGTLLGLLPRNRSAFRHWRQSRGYVSFWRWVCSFECGHKNRFSRWEHVAVLYCTCGRHRCPYASLDRRHGSSRYSSQQPLQQTGTSKKWFFWRSRLYLWAAVFKLARTSAVLLNLHWASVPSSSLWTPECRKNLQFSQTCRRDWGGWQHSSNVTTDWAFMRTVSNSCTVPLSLSIHSARRYWL